jgi:TM2 domain-containing membrane protein YozV
VIFVAPSPPAVRRVVAISPDDGSAIDLRNPIVAALLSWLVPGLGQIYQGRTRKGLIVMLPILATVLAGLWLTAGRAAFWDPRPGAGRQHLFFLATQGEIGCVAIPAIASAKLFAGSGEDLSTWHRRLGRFYDIGWLYTVIAGFMNLLVIYDALCGPMRPADKDQAGAEPGVDDPGRQGRPAR